MKRWWKEMKKSGRKRNEDGFKVILFNLSFFICFLGSQWNMMVWKSREKKQLDIFWSHSYNSAWESTWIKMGESERFPRRKGKDRMGNLVWVEQGVWSRYSHTYVCKNTTTKPLFCIYAYLKITKYKSQNILLPLQ